jgi:hypothetical protein
VTKAAETFHGRLSAISVQPSAKGPARRQAVGPGGEREEIKLKV